MIESEIDAYVESRLPEWAVRFAIPHVLEVGAQLRTRDGRVMGNAHIVAVKAGVLDTGRAYYTILTDAGSTAVMNSTEINDVFWPPKHISRLAEVLAKFDRTGELSNTA